MKTKFFFVVSATMLLTACNSNDEVVTSFDDDTPKVSNEFAMSNEEATEVLNFFVNDGATTRNEGKMLDVKSYKVRNVEVKTEDKTENVPVYEYTTVNEDGEEGYSIIIGDKRIQKVLIQVEKGSTFDTIENIVLKSYIESIPYKVEYDLKNYYNNIATGKLTNQPQTRDFYIVTQECLLPTEWRQTSPYNIACPTSSCCINGHAKTGCVPLAIAQILAYHHVPSNLNWTQILQQTKITDSTPQTCVEQVANLIHDQWDTVHAFMFDIDGECGTGVSENNMPLVKNAFNSYSLVCSNLKNYNLDDIIFSLNLEYPVFICAKTSDEVKHAWVTDGYKAHVYGTDSYYYLHMNWGQNGNSNGYYYAEPGNVSFVMDEYQLNYEIKIITDIH